MSQAQDAKILRPCPQLAKEVRISVVPKLQALPFHIQEMLKEVPRDALNPDKDVPRNASIPDMQKPTKMFNGSTRPRASNSVSAQYLRLEETQSVDVRWQLSSADKKELEKLFKDSDANKNNLLEEEEIESNVGQIESFFIQHGVSLQVFRDNAHLSFDEFLNTFQRCKELTRKIQCLIETDIITMVASHLKGGSPQEPLQELENMSDAVIESWCRESLTPDLILLMKFERDKLLSQKRQTKAPEDVENNNEKYAYIEAQFGNIDDYYRGIVDQLGFPNSRLMDALIQEHCRRGDSKDLFIAGNYQEKTCPEREWYAVFDREKAKAINASGKNNREIRYYKDLLGCDQVQQAQLREEEILALQLYSGPMFEKYNTSLRQYPRDKFKNLKGNTYATTIFLIVSGIIKLSQTMELPEDRYVWRGLKNLKLPDAFLRKNKNNFRGGLEASFMSTTTDKAVAVQYAGEGKEDFPMLFKIQIGAIDRGADISFLSQYPNEKEILFPPMSFIEVVGNVEMQVLANKHVVRVVPLKINANQMTKTIDQFLQQRQGLHLSMLQNFELEIKYELAQKMESEAVQKRLSKDAFCAWHKHHEQLRDNILQEVHAIIERSKETKYEAYNQDDFYSKEMKSALEMRILAIRKFDFWLDNPSVQARLIAPESLKKVERILLADLHSKYAEAMMAVAQDGHDKVHDVKTRALTLCKARGCCLEDVNETNELEETPMYVEAAEGNVANVEYIFDAGGSVNDEAKDKSTPLMAAAFGGSLKVCRFLVEKGARILDQDKHGHTCLYKACESGTLDVVKFLVEEALENDKDKDDLLLKTREDGLSCLIIASKNGHTDVVKYLVKKGGDALIDLKRKDDCSAAHMAAMFGHLEIVECLVEQKKDLIWLKDTAGITPLWIASSNGQVAVVKYLLEQARKWGDQGEKSEKSLLFEKGKRNPINLTTETETQMTCLQIASFNGHRELCEYLLECGERHTEGAPCFAKELLEVKDSAGATCFMHACQNGQRECAKYFLDHKFGGKELVKQRLSDGSTCMHLACESGNDKLVQLLLKKDGQELLSVVNNDGATCLDFALKSGHLKCAKLVLEHKESLLDSNRKNGRTCLHAACESGKREVVKWLLVVHKLKSMLKQADDQSVYCFDKACQKGHVHICEYLLDGVDRNDIPVSEGMKERLIACCDEKEEMCLQACDCGKEGLAKWLSVDEMVNSKLGLLDGQEETCFHAACQKGHIQVCEYLLDRTERHIDRKDTSGDTEEKEKLISSRNKQGQTCLHMVCENGNVDLLEWLFTQEELFEAIEKIYAHKDQNGKTCLELLMLYITELPRSKLYLTEISRSEFKDKAKRIVEKFENKLKRTNRK